VTRCLAASLMLVLILGIASRSVWAQDILLPALFLSARGQTNPAKFEQELPSFKGKVVCERGEQKKQVFSGLGSSQVVGVVDCDEEVILPANEVELSHVGGSHALVIEPIALRSYSPSDKSFYTAIMFGKPVAQRWIKAEVKLLPNQGYEIVIVGKVVNRSVCDKHGGYSKTEPSETSDPLRLYGRFVVCKDGSRIRVD
jgi:hypothetical protein